MLNFEQEFSSLYTAPRFAAGGFVKFSIRFGDVPITRIHGNSLPRGWRSPVEGKAAQEIGDDWIAENKSAILALPSAILPEEENYLLNPKHPDFERLHISPARSFAFDPQLYSSVQSHGNSGVGRSSGGA